MTTADIDLLRRRWELPTALAASERALAESPHDPQAVVAHVRVLLAMNREDDAAELTSRQLEDPSISTWHLVALSQSGAYEDAIAFGLEAIKRFPDHALARVALGRAYSGSGYEEEALELYAAAAALSPSDWRPARWYALGLADLYRWSEAVIAGERLVAEYPTVAKCHHTLGQIHLKRDAPQEALPHFDAAIELDPDFSYPYQYRGTALVEMSRFAEAQEWEAKAIERFPRASDLLVSAAWTFSIQDREDEAVPLAERAIALDPRSNWALCSLADFESYRLRHEAAATAVGKAIALRPLAASARLTAAWLALRDNDDDDAVTAITDVVRLNARNSQAVNSRIAILRLAGRLADSVTAAEEALRLRPPSPWTAIAAATTFQQAEQPDRALEVLATALETHPLHSNLLRTRVSHLQKTGRTAEVAEAVQVALSRRPDDVEINVMAAAHYSSLDDETKALELVDRALAVRPDHAGALAARIDYLRYLSRYEDACDTASRGLSLHPGSAALQLAAINAYMAHDRYEDALAQAEKALAGDPTNTSVLVKHVDCLRYLCRFADAHKVADQALVDQPDSITLRMAKAEVFHSESRYPEAIALVTRVRADLPEYTWALRRHLSYLANAHRFAEAAALADEAVAAHPDDANVLMGVAWLRSMLSHEGAAAELGRRAVALSPTNLWARQSLIQFLRYARRFDEALAMWEPFGGSPDADALITRAWLASDMGDDEGAIAWCERALGSAPRYVWALTTRVWLLHKADRLADAQAAAAAALALRPDNVDVHATDAWLRLELDDAEGALVAADRALEISPRDSDALDHKILALFRLHRVDQAERVIRAAQERQPTNLGLQLALAKVHEHRLAFDAAAQCTTAAMREVPDDPDCGVALSSTLRSLRRYGEAERVTMGVIRTHPHRRDTRAELGWIHHDERRLADARRVFQDLLDDAVNERERRSARYGLGWVAFSAGDHATAEAEFRLLPKTDFAYRLALAWALTRQDGVSRWREGEAIAAELVKLRDDPSAHICLGVAAFRQGQLASAEYHFKRALDIDPYHGSHADLGALYVQMGRYEEAEVELNRAIARDWYDAAAHVELGALLLRTDRLPEAEREFRQALAVDPASGAAAIGVAQALAKAGDEAEAESTLRAALLRQDAPARWRTNLAIARLLVQRGDKQQNADLHAEAYAHAQGALETAPDKEADPHFVAGVAHHRMGSLAADARGRFWYRQRALSHLRECLKRDPGHADAQRNLHLLERELKAVAPAIWGGYAVAVVSIALLATLWITFFTTTKVTAVMLTTTTPVLVGLFTIAVLLPSLIRLKLPGFEADLQAGTGPISPGPTGQVTFGPGRFTVTTGPTGQLPRRE
ncbi:tetratricopeptide repeat protein [Actinokineospora terrae]|uniref:Tfp pilus assembly protein PilF n=1 Tax=Actinokineospora terrae TaxID=155974 RepID=A0A1H9KGX9_9PSEU|nr:tetratricopeptide repeat protein [Actinokineospora terrae]SEQ98400.1 Tfp pilus assembly protein PilF [Actinokineospora terrae]